MRNLVKNTNRTINFAASSLLGLDFTGSCIQFNITGDDGFIYAYSDCSEPYESFFGCGGSTSLKPGEYTVTAVQCFPECKRRSRILFTSRSAAGFGVPETQKFLVSNDFGVEDFVVVDELTKEEMRFINTNIPRVGVVEGGLYNIEVKTFGRVDSVMITLSGPIQMTRIENHPSYDTFGLRGSELVPGIYTITAQPFTENKAQGEAGAMVEFTFEVNY